MSDLRDYHAWNIAALRFGAAPDVLSPEQAARLDDEVTRALTLSDFGRRVVRGDAT